LLFCFLLSNLVVWTGLDGGVSFSLHADYFPKAALFSRKAHGDEKRMLVLFFDGVWPISSPSTLFGQVGVSKSGYSTSQVSHLLIDIEVENRTSSEFFQFL
jgi:hypothetical protein